MKILKYLETISFEISMDNLFIGIILISFFIGIIYFIFKIFKKKFNKKIKVAELNIEIGKIGKVKIEVNNEVAKIAHKTWVEIMTRKVGLKFEEDKDVIVEVYNSWYQLFSIIRELLKEVEPDKKDKNFEKLENILISTLNEGLRPHLTRWQAKFRRWYDKEILKEENEQLTPQEIQKKYIYYNELIEDLKKTNEKMLGFSQELKKLI